LDALPDSWNGATSLKLPRAAASGSVLDGVAASVSAAASAVAAATASFLPSFAPTKSIESENTRSSSSSVDHLLDSSSATDSQRGSVTKELNAVAVNGGEYVTWESRQDFVRAIVDWWDTEAIPEEQQHE